MAEMTVDDTCPCGAEFRYTGYHLYAASRHTDWLGAHKVCREREPQPGASLPYRDDRMPDTLQVATIPAKGRYATGEADA